MHKNSNICLMFGIFATLLPVGHYDRSMIAGVARSNLSSTYARSNLSTTHSSL